MPENKIQYVILYGGFETGYELVGSFGSFEKARGYAKEHMKYAIWEIIMVQHPIHLVLSTEDGNS